jgi:tetratricopeptide (TPR) repeat protein
VLFLRMALKLGATREGLRDSTAAEAAYRRAVELLDARRSRLLDSGQFSQEEWRGESADALEAVGGACAAGERFAEATAAYRAARERAGDDPARAARLHWHIAEGLAAQRQHRDALKTLDFYVETRPANLAAFELKVRLLGQLGRDAEIIPSLKADAARQPEFLALQLLLARALSDANQAEEAESLFRDRGSPASAAGGKCR